MPMRASRISLGEDNPVGQHRFELTGLDSADLILIVGPNGSGKSSLLGPLRKPGELGDVYGPDNKTRFNARGVQQTIAFVSSQDLMEKVRSLRAAIALAAGAGMHLVYEKVLTTCVNRLSDDDDPNVQVESPELSQLRTDCLHWDSLCGANPRTVECYNDLGQTLANAANTQWTGFHSDPEVRRHDEAKVLPVFGGLVGLGEVDPVLKKIQSISTTARSTLQSVVDAQSAITTKLTTIRQETPLPSDLSATAAIEWLSNAEKALKKLINAKDQLAACRESALSYFMAQQAGNDPPVHCPVCDQAIDAAAVQAHLNAIPHSAQGDNDPDSTLRNQYVGWHSDLVALVRRLEGVVTDAEHAVDHCRTVLNQARDSLAVPINWHTTVQTAALQVRDAAVKWLATHTASLTSQAVTDLSALAAQAASANTTLTEAQGDLTRRQEPLRQLYNSMTALGQLLHARTRLNSVVHVVNLDEEEAAARRRVRRDVWVRILGALREHHAESAGTARDRVLDNIEVKERFTRLMTKFHSIDRWLADLSYDGRDDVNSGCAVHGDQRIKDLSEGQTVLVNLAAALTVASVVAGNEAHTPGWIVFDEPTNGLDQTAVNLVAEYLGSMSNADLPAQIFVATFDERFASTLRDRAQAVGRRVRVITLDRFDRGKQDRRFAPASDNTFTPAANHTDTVP